MKSTEEKQNMKEPRKFNPRGYTKGVEKKKRYGGRDGE